MWYYIIVERQKTKNLKEVVIMIMFVFVFFALVGIVVWFFEETKIGKKLVNKIYNNIMKK